MADIIGTDDDETLLGTAGNDRILGLGGDDVLNGRDGDDVVEGGDGNDLVVDFLGANRLDGGAGHDLVYAALDSIEAHGGEGDDVLGLNDRGEQQDVIVDLEKGTTSTGFRFSGFESVLVTLGAGDDVVFGASGIRASVYAGEGDNLVIGSDSDELFQGGSGDDVMLGKGGNDVLVGYGGDDVLDGGEGDDLVWLYKPEGVVRGGDGHDTLHIQAEDLLQSLDFDALAGTMDTGLAFSGFESYRVQTTVYNENDDTDDTLRGGHGNDVFHSGTGEDLIDGRGGDDEIWGGEDADVLIGGAGADTFYWDRDAAPGNGVDRVVDFDPDSGDVLRFGTDAKNQMGIGDFDEFLELATDTEAGVFIPFGEGSSDGILLEGVELADLSADDILFY